MRLNPDLVIEETPKIPLVCQDVGSKGCVLCERKRFRHVDNRPRRGSKRLWDSGKRGMARSHSGIFFNIINRWSLSSEDHSDTHLCVRPFLITKIFTGL